MSKKNSSSITRHQHGTGVLTAGSIVVLVVFALYALLTFTTEQTQTSQEMFRLTEFQIFVIRLTIAFPYLFMWLSAVYCIQKFSDLKASSTRYRTFADRFAWGFAVLLAGMLATSLLSAIRGHQTVSDTSLVPFLTITSNYIYALVPVVAFFLMYRGASSLSKTDDINSLVQSIVSVLLVGVTYIPLIFTNPNRQIAFSHDNPPTYYISDFLIVVTLVVPSLVSWIVGLMVAYKVNKMFVSINAKRIGMFVNGIFYIIFSSMMLQLILSLGSERLFTLGIGPILILVYLFIFAQVGGFILAAIGVHALSEATDNIEQP